LGRTDLVNTCRKRKMTSTAKALDEPYIRKGILNRNQVIPSTRSPRPTSLEESPSSPTNPAGPSYSTAGQIFGSGQAWRPPPLSPSTRAQFPHFVELDQSDRAKRARLRTQDTQHMRAGQRPANNAARIEALSGPVPPTSNNLIHRIDFSQLPPRRTPYRPVSPHPSPCPHYAPQVERPSYSADEDQVIFTGYDPGLALNIYNRPEVLKTSSPLFSLFSAPSRYLQARLPSPFPPGYHHVTLGEGESIVKVVVIASKSKISKLASERNRARRRFRSALDMVVNRGVGLLANDGKHMMDSSMFILTER